MNDVVRPRRWFSLLLLVVLLATAAGNVAAQGPGEKGPEAGMASQVVGPLLGPTVNGTLDDSDPTFTRPDVSAAVTVNCASAWTPVIGVVPYYEAHAFHVTNNSPIQIEVNAAGTTINDTFLIVSCQPFNAAIPIVNGVIMDDDDGAGFLSAITLADNVTLMPGKTYWAVITTYGPLTTGTYRLDFSDNVVLGAPPKKWAWSTNAGWINFAPTYGGVTVSGAGNFTGYAWSENLGWIKFNGTAGGNTPYQVQVRCVIDVNASGTVDVVDVQLVTSAFGMNVPAYDFNKDGVVNVLDIQFVAHNWLVGC